jgi:uncharacterized membrane protein
MVGKICYGSIRVVVGILMLQAINMPFSEIWFKLLGGEMAIDKSGVIANYLTSMISHLSFPITYFLSFYVFFWGVIDVLIGVSLLRHKMWAFPSSLALIGTFVVYEIYRYFHTYSPFLLIAIFIDILTCYLIWLEYRKLKPKKMAQNNNII